MSDIIFRPLINSLKNQVVCNKCGYDTPRDKAVIDCGYDDWGHQCIACASVSGLSDKVERQKKEATIKLERRKQFGL